MTDRQAIGLDALLSSIDYQQQLINRWPEDYQSAVAAQVQAIDALNGEAFRRLIKALTENPASAPAVRSAVADEVVYAVLRRHGLLKPSLFERVEQALETIRPMLASHGGDVELVAVSPPQAEVRLLGACDGCPASAMTFYSGVKQAILEHVPEITNVRQLSGIAASNRNEPMVSPFSEVSNHSDVAAHSQWVALMRLTELDVGSTTVKSLAGQSLLVTRFVDSVTCFINACSHMGMTMDEGVIAHGQITCPHHGFQYSLATGRCLTAADLQLQTVPLRRIGDRIEVMSPA